MKYIKLILVFMSFVMIIVRTVPALEMKLLSKTEDKEVAKQQEVSVETFTVQEPESPPLPVTVLNLTWLKEAIF